MFYIYQLERKNKDFSTLINFINTFLKFHTYISKQLALIFLLHNLFLISSSAFQLN
jgi:hypothetical protein